MLLLVILIGSILFFVIGNSSTACCVQFIVDSGFLQFYRIFISQFIEASILSMIFGLFAMFSTAPFIEKHRGSIFTLHAFLVCSVLTNILNLLVQALFLYGFKWELAEMFCAAGVWPSIMAFIVIETKLYTTENRPFMCCPIQVPVRWYPWIMLLLFSLMLALRPVVSLVSGVLIGYLYMATPLQLSSVGCHYIESLSLLQCLVSMPSFVSSASAAGYSVSGGDGGGMFGGLLNGNAQQANDDMEMSRRGDASSSRTFGSGQSGSTDRPRAVTFNDLQRDEESQPSFSMGSSTASSSTTATTTTTSAFKASTGHRLGGASTSTFSLPFISQSSTHAAAQRTAAVDRLARLARSNAPADSSSVTDPNTVTFDANTTTSTTTTTTASSGDRGHFTIDDNDEADDTRVKSKANKQHGGYVALDPSVGDEDEDHAAPYTPWTPSQPVGPPVPKHN